MGSRGLQEEIQIKLQKGKLALQGHKVFKEPLDLKDRQVLLEMLDSLDQLEHQVHPV